MQIDYINSDHKKIAATIAAAVEKGSLALKEGSKNWHGYRLNITGLTWSRNFQDGYQIEVYKNNTHILTATI